MATPFRLKRSALPGKRPTLSDLQLGELAFNTYDGYLFAERDTSGVGIGTTISLLTPWTENFGGGSIYYQNSVGIGTAIPSASLHVSGNAIFSGNTSSELFRITQTGSGPALLVEDSENPDVTPFVVTTDGRIGVGIGQGGLGNYAMEVGGGSIRFVTASEGDLIISHSNLVSRVAGAGSIQLALGANDSEAIRINLNNNVGIGSTIPTSKLDIIGDVKITGITTVGSLSIGSTQVISSARQLQNIASLDSITTATIEAAITNAPNTFTDITVTGISTLGVTSATNLTAQQINVSGVSTLGITTISQLNVSGASELNATTISQLNVSGISTLGVTSATNLTAQQLNVSGIITASSFDGSINAPGKTYYVAVNGNNSNTGNNLNEPYATLKHALSVSTSGDTVFVQSGTFSEDFPLTVPVGVTVKGVGLRGTIIQPNVGAAQTRDCFLLNGETTIEDLTVANIYEPGYAFRFADNSKTTNRSPYIQRVTVLNKGSVITATDPYGFDTPHSPPTSYKAGRGALIDGSVVDSTTLEPAMLFNECTFITPNNIALEMTNGARSEWVNCFSYFADKGIYAYDGTVGIASTGYVRIKTSGLTTTSSTPAANDELYYLEANSQSGTYDQVGTALTITKVGHGLTVGDRIFADFTSGTATDGFYRVTGYIGINTFSVTMVGSATTSGNVSYKEALGFGTVRSYTPASGLSSITGKGEGLFELPSTRLGKTVTSYGDAALSTSQEKFGTASLLLDGTGDYARCEGGTDFAFAGNFTAEAWIYPTSVTGSRHLFALGTETTGRYHLSLESGVVTGNFYGSASTTFGGSISINTWTHIALVRSGSTITAYVDGVALGTTETNSSSIGNTGQLTIGADTSGANAFAGYIDEVRISNIARYTGTFTSSTTAFNSDGNDKLLLHFDGVTGSTSFTDSSIPTQDIRWVRSGVGIATATRIILADYQQFGAEMRSIGSAVVFGNTGIVADGPGVGLRLFAFNFGHIGSGKDFSQDVSLVNQSAEVVKTNNSNVYFVSIDQSGDFRVGDAFYVNQEAGTVNFGGQNFTINSLSDLNITDGTNTTTITPTTLTVGNIQISGNEITSTSGDITINPSGSSQTNVSGDLNVSGILTASILQTAALQLGDTSIAIDDTGSNGTIRFNTDNVEALRITSNQRVGIGITNPTSKLYVQGDTLITGIVTATTYDTNLTRNGSVTATTATTSQTAIHTGLSTSSYRSIEYTIQGTEGANYHSTKILVVHDGTTAYHSEYGTVYNNTTVATYDVDISGGNLRLLATPASSSSTTFKISFTSIVV